MDTDGETPVDIFNREMVDYYFGKDKRLQQQAVYRGTPHPQECVPASTPLREPDSPLDHRSLQPIEFHFMWFNYN